MRKLCRLFATGLAVALAPALLTAQQAATISGRVTGELAQPLNAVSVVVPTLGAGTLTRPDGTFSLTIPPGRYQAGQAVQVQASLVGYRTQTQNVTLSGGNSTANFELAVDPLRLEQIVVTGAGTEQRAVRLGTARSTVDAPQIQRTAEPNIVTALAGKAANVVTHQQSGEAGAGTAVRIRGTSTLAGTGQPLFVVDGVPMNNETRSTGNADPAGSPLQGTVTQNPMSHINPDDIESIEILKGPAAASIYGAQAGAGGAILITTKRGRPGETRYTLRSSIQLDQAANLFEQQHRYGVGTGGVAPSCQPGGAVNCFLAAGFQSWGPELPASTPTYDHIGEMYETGRIWDNTMSISGGSDRTTFYLSVGSLNHNGYIVTDADTYKRYTVRLNGTHRLLDNLNIGGNASYVETDGNYLQRGNSVNGTVIGAVRTPAEFDNKQYVDPVTGLHRTWRFPNPGPGALTTNRGFDNPFWVIHETVNSGTVGRVMGSVFVNWNALPWLTVNYNLGADYTSDDRLEGLPITSSGAAAGGLVTRWQFYDKVLDSNLTATASHQFNDNLAGTLTVGQNLNESTFRQVWVRGRGLIAGQPFKLENTTTRDTPTDQEERARVDGYFAQGTLDIADQLFLTAGIRNDGSSRFGLDNQRAWYPRAQAAWSFSETLNLPTEGPFNFGKLRIAYGESGQQPDFYLLQDIFTNAILSDFSPGSQLIPNLGGIGGIYSSVTRGNLSLGPERVKEIEAGFDLGLLDGRVELGVTHYRQNAEDVIFSLPQAGSTGFTAQSRNAAEVENVGWETTLNIRAYETADYSIAFNMNWAKNDNELISLGDSAITVVNFAPNNFSFGGRTTNAIVGQPLGVFYGTDFARCGRGLGVVSGQDIGAACANAPDGALYIGANGFPVRDPDVRVIGSPHHDWTAGFGTEIGIMGVRLSAFVDHRQGGTVQNMTKASMYQYGTHKDTEIRGEQRTFGTAEWWPGEVVGPGAGTAVTIGEGWFTGDGSIGGPSAPFQEDATHTRLREASIAYTFNQSWVRETLGLSAIDARITGRNLKLWTDYTGFDPEGNLGGAEVQNRGIDWMINPLSRAWVFSVGLTY